VKPTRAFPSLPRRIEWPTLLVAAAIYGGWMVATWFHQLLPGWGLAIIGGWLVAWHGSLQHETIHGHPTRNARLNALVGFAPLALWLPYSVYRRTHVTHHRTPHVTDPFEDPESRYLARDAGRAGAFLRLSAGAQATLAGRLILGPPLTIADFLLREAQRAAREPKAALLDWAPHLVAVSAICAWLRFCGLDLAAYALCFVYPGTALALLRSYAEHRADPLPGRRVAIVEGAGPLALLFLNNNLHAAHHRAPGLPWYRLPAFHNRHRERLLAGNGGLLYRGYGEVARRFLFRAHDVLVHPGHREEHEA